MNRRWDSGSLRTVLRSWLWLHVTNFCNPGGKPIDHKPGHCGTLGWWPQFIDSRAATSELLGTLSARATEGCYHVAVAEDLRTAFARGGRHEALHSPQTPRLRNPLDALLWRIPFWQGRGWPALRR